MSLLLIVSLVVVLCVGFAAAGGVYCPNGGTDCLTCYYTGCSTSNNNCRTRCGTANWESAILTDSYLCTGGNCVPADSTNPLECLLDTSLTPNVQYYNCYQANSGNGDGCESTAPCCKTVNNAQSAGDCATIIPTAANVESWNCDNKGACSIDTCAKVDGVLHGNCNGANAIGTIDGCEVAVDLTTRCGSACTSCVAYGTTAISVASWACEANVDGTDNICVPTCAANKYNCNLNVADGCESSLPCCSGATNTNAGLCSTNANYPQVATYTCAAGQCNIATCASGRFDCDGNTANGCESSNKCCGAGADTSACFAPALNVATPACDANSSCTFNSASGCVATFFDCNGVVSDGCENDAKCCTVEADCTGIAITPATGAEVTDFDCISLGCVIKTCTASPRDSILTCPSGTSETQGDCNGKAMDGCEAPIDLDTSCGTTCLSCTAVAADAALHVATGTCTVAPAAGACDIACDSDWFDCNQDPSDGCETQIPCCTRAGATGPFDLSTGCSAALTALTSVPTANLSTISGYTCVNGECDLGGCTTNHDCDKSVLNGCESILPCCSVATVQADCASAFANVSIYVCAAGVCNIDPTDGCASGTFDCDGNHQNGCESYTPCCARNGAIFTPTPCAIAAGWAHISTYVCDSNGACTINSGSCSTNFQNCDSIITNGCETDLTLPTSCGGCSTNCNDIAGSADRVTSWSCNASFACEVTCDNNTYHCSDVPADGCESDFPCDYVATPSANETMTPSTNNETMTPQTDAPVADTPSGDTPATSEPSPSSAVDTPVDNSSTPPVTSSPAPSTGPSQQPSDVLGDGSLPALCLVLATASILLHV